MIKYFVSYTCWDENGNQGFGNAVFDSTGKLDNIEAINDAQRKLAEHNAKDKITKVLILNMQAL